MLIAGLTCGGCGSSDDASTAVPRASDSKGSPRKADFGTKENRNAGVDLDLLQTWLSDSDLEPTRLDQIETVIAKKLTVDPDDPMALTLAASAAMHRGDWSTSSRLLRDVFANIDGGNDARMDDFYAATFVRFAMQSPSSVGVSPVDSLTRAAFETHLQNRPSEVKVRRWWADALDREGFRETAARHRQILLASGVEDATLLRQLTSRRRDPTSNVAAIESDQVADEPTSSLRRAVVDFDRVRYLDGLQTLRSAFDRVWVSDEHAALYGHLAALSQRTDHLLWWLERCPDSARGFANYWSAVGHAWQIVGRDKTAAECFFRAIAIDPTLVEDYQSLSLALRNLDEEAFAEAVTTRGKTVGSIQSLVSKIRAQSSATFLITTLAKRLNEVGRPLEAIAWRLEQLGASGNAAALSALRDQRRRLVMSPNFQSSIQSYARFETIPTAIESRAALRRAMASKFPSAAGNLAGELSGDGKLTETDRDGESPFVLPVDIADEVNLSFDYLNRRPRALSRIRIFEQIGGGIGVGDYDRSGSPDLFCAQGGGDLPEKLPTDGGTLFRNLGQSFVAEDDIRLGSEPIYATGVAVGDLNSDGWCDYVIGGLGSNQVWINQGDGTFRSDNPWQRAFDTIADEGTANELTSSVVIADVDGDALADLVEANYARDAKSMVRIRPPKNGIPAAISPTEFIGGVNRLWVGRADGGWTLSRLDGPRGDHSLGILVGDLSETIDGCEILIGNDLGPNQYWVSKKPQNVERRSRSSRAISDFEAIRQEASGDEDRIDSDFRRWTDQAEMMGIAYDAFGHATASMGLAAADINDDHQIDVHIANFAGESSGMYVGDVSRPFVDRAAFYGLTGPTDPMVGFGSRFADLDADGRLELIIVNGHIEDLRSIGRPFRMSPQIMTIDAGGTTMRSKDADPLSVSDIDKTSYWNRPSVGRSVACLDWNSDQRIDLVVNHLDRPVALLENRSSHPPMLQLTVVGTDDHRDAIGTIVEVVNAADEVVSKQWLVAGGYLSTDERCLWLRVSQKQTIVIRWPDGSRQLFAAPANGGRFLAVQGQAQPWPLTIE